MSPIYKFQDGQVSTAHAQENDLSIYEGCSLISANGLITLTVSVLWQCALYQMKAGSLPSREIPNTLIFYARLFGHCCLIQHAHVT